MRVEIRKRPYDLYAVLGASTILVIIILINEFANFEIPTVRVIFGLLFILFIPGYVLISALYPEKKRFFDRNGDPIEKEEWEKLVEENEEKEGDGEKLPDGKGLDDLERVALSLGLSIAISPLIGLVLNYTYDWGEAGGFGNEFLGIRVIPVTLSIFLFILITGIIAVRRRQRTPIEDRYGIVIDASIPEDYSTMDKVLTIGIVIMMVVSVSLLIYIIVVPREGESFSELYILGSTGMAEKYPRNMYLEETGSITIGVGNHEHESMEYTLIMTISSEAENSTVDSFDNVTISRNRQPSMMVSVPDGETVEIPCNFSVLETGSYKLRILLFRDGKEYRDVHLWIKVFTESRLDRSEDGIVEVYLTDTLGDPSGLSSSPGEMGTIGLGIGIRNTGLDDISCRVMISDNGINGQVEFEEIRNNTIIFSEGIVHTFDLKINYTSSLDVLPIFINLDGYTGEIVVRFDTGSDQMTTWLMENREV